MNDAIERRVAFLRSQRATLIAYLKAKLDAEDWHACADAAMDIREIDSVLKELTHGL